MSKYRKNPKSKTIIEELIRLKGQNIQMEIEQGIRDILEGDTFFNLI